MRTIPYDTTRDALYHPEICQSIFLTVNNPSDALLCAEASRLVYKKCEKLKKERAAVEAAFRRVGFTDVALFCREGSQAIGSWNPARRIALVAFRGTEQDPTDLAADLKTWKTSWPRGGHVHAGFQEALTKIWPDIEVWLQAHAGRLWLTGHSLGAALATLAASLKTPEKLITFGSPKVGDEGFVKTLAGIRTITRYVDCCDIVSRVPPGLFGFVDVGALHYIDRWGVVQSKATESLVEEDRASAREEYILEHAWRLGSVALRDLADHAPVNYVAPLQHAAQGAV